MPGLTEADTRIRQRILLGDPDGMEHLVQAYDGVVRGLLVRLVGPDASEDLVQEVFLRAYANMERFRGEASLGWWISRIASNCGRRYLKRRRAACVDIQSVAIPDPTPGPEDQVIRDEDRAQARRALQGLPGADRELLLLREVLGLSYEEIQRQLEISRLGTVKSRLHKARESLRRAWGYRTGPKEGERA